MKTKLPIFAAVLLMWGSPVFAQTSVLFNFESGNVDEWDLWSYGSEIVCQTTVVHSGTYAMRYKHVEGETRYATAWAPAPETNWVNYGQVSYWARSDIDTGQNTVKIKLQEEGGEEWIQKQGTILTRSFTNILADLSSTVSNGFEVAAGVNWELELGRITNVTLVFDAQSVHSPYYVYYFIDDIELLPLPQVADINLSTSSVHFGTVNPSPADHRFLSSPVRVDYEVSGYTNTWRMEIYSTHASGRLGLIGEQNSDFFLPLKCWYGPTNFVPQDPEDDWNWGNAYSYVTEETNQWHPTLAVSTNSPISTGFHIYFATDATSVYTQEYSTAVTVELMIE